MTAQSNLLNAIDKLAGRRVLVVGDVICDQYVFGAPTRVSREAPVLVLDQMGETTNPGGAANAAANLRALGGEPLLVGVVGADAQARLLTETLGALDIGSGGLVTEAGRPTTTKTRVFAEGPSGQRRRGQQLVRLDRHSRARLARATVSALEDKVDAGLARAQAVLISDYGYGAVDGAQARLVIDRSHRRRLQVVVDSQADLDIFRGADVITPNLAELERWAGSELGSDAAVARAAGSLRRKLRADAVVCTRGGDGITVITTNGVTHTPVAPRVEVFDVAGAGDTVAATLALGLAAGLRLAVAAQLANCAGSVVVRKLGAASCTPAELRRAVKSAARTR